MLKNISILAIITVLFITACKKEQSANTSDPGSTSKSKSKSKSSQNSPKQTDHDLLQGHWAIQVDICCGRNKRTREGDQLDFSKELIFQDTSVYIHYQKHGEQLQKELHGYKTKTEERVSGTVKYINLGFPDRYGMYKVTKDTLIIDYGYMDLQKEIYLRKGKK